MGERKVISKYYPPDFDPSKVPRAKGVKKHNTIKVVMMLPMSIRCNTCGEYIGRGTKFNSKKETVEGEEYLGLKVYRFYIRCRKCAAELAIKTDPKNSEYVCEIGATRNYEPWKETAEEKAERMKMEQEEKEDSMKALENRTIESKREMDILDGLDELRALNARNADIDTEQLLEYSLKKQQENEERLREEDELIIQEMFHSKKEPQVKRIDEDSESAINELKNNIIMEPKKVEPKKSILGNNVKVLKRSGDDTSSSLPPSTKITTGPALTSTSSSLFQYSSDDEEED